MKDSIPLTIINYASLKEKTRTYRHTLDAITRLEMIKASHVDSTIRESVGKASDSLSEYLKEIEKWIAAEMMQSYRAQYCHRDGKL